MKKILYIHNLPVERWEEYKDLYVTAVKNEPLAFSETYEEILKSEDKEWKEELQDALDRQSVMVFAECEGKLIGMYSGSFHKREKLKHNAFLASLFVSEEFRWLGVGKMLIQKIVELILKNSVIKNVHCEIIQTQVASIAVHKKLGFEITGEIKDLIFVNGKYISEYWLEKQIR